MAQTLLVVDDEELNRDLLSRRLARKGYEVVCAEGGVEALELVDSEEIDLVLLDIMMPVMDGLEVLRRLRVEHSPAALPIIMATAKSGSDDVVGALELGANDYVTKPLDFPVVLARVEALLRLKAASEAAHRKARETPGVIGAGSTLAGKYHLEEEIGAGSFGRVFRARHQGLESDVAIKVLQTGTAAATAIDRFRREGVSASRIQHRNAVRVHDFEVLDDGTAFMVMELLAGESLEQLLRAGPLSPSRAVEIVIPVCEVLAEAHAEGVIHRDIKPGNVFVHHEQDDEVVKVLDFGIAKLIGEAVSEESLTAEGFLLGTPNYMAPERFRQAECDGQADVYSVGVMLFRMLSGRLPFVPKSPDPIQIGMLHLRAKAPRLSELAPGVSDDLDALVDRLLAKNPEQRPGAAALAEELARVSLGDAAEVAPRNSASEATGSGPSDETTPLSKMKGSDGEGRGLLSRLRDSLGGRAKDDSEPGGAS